MKNTQSIVNDILTNIDYDSETVNWQNAYFTFRNEIASTNKISIDSFAVKTFLLFIKQPYYESLRNLIFCLYPSSIFSGTTGKVTGLVTEKDSEHHLLGVI